MGKFDELRVQEKLEIVALLVDDCGIDCGYARAIFDADDEQRRAMLLRSFVCQKEARLIDKDSINDGIKIMRAIKEAFEFLISDALYCREKLFADEEVGK